MTREEAHQLVDKLYDFEEHGVLVSEATVNEDQATIEVGVKNKRELPKDKRVVRTKSSGDRVYFIDEDKKTRQWITNPKVLEGLGFTLTDVKEIEDSELLQYQMAAALYKVENA